MSPQPHIIIVGGGFAGLYAAQNLAELPAMVTLIDRRNFHLFQPLLYQVATGGLSPANIAAPLRAILKQQKNTSVVLGEVNNIDARSQSLSLADGSCYSYDYLVLATGASHNYFGNDSWERYAPGLKTIEDATEIRKRLLSAFEAAELEPDPIKQRDLIRFVIVGGGATGVELSGAIGEIAHQTLKDNFRNFDPAEAEIILLEGGTRILESFAPQLSEKAKLALERLGVTVLESSFVIDIQSDSVSFRRADKTERIITSCVLWAAGVQASSLGRILARETGVSLDRAGRVMVASDLSIPGHDNIFVLGDLACVVQEGKQVPGVAPAAMQAGAYIAKVLKHRIGNSRPPPSTFYYRDRGSMATICRSLAVAQIGRLNLSGFIAWIAWLFIHIMFLVEFSNRILVVVQWGWNYLTRNRTARLITGENTTEKR